MELNINLFLEYEAFTRLAGTKDLSLIFVDPYNPHSYKINYETDLNYEIDFKERQRKN